MKREREVKTERERERGEETPEGGGVKRRREMSEETGGGGGGGGAKPERLRQERPPGEKEKDRETKKSGRQQARDRLETDGVRSVFALLPQKPAGLLGTGSPKWPPRFSRSS